jgi:hypothetical protein
MKKPLLIVGLGAMTGALSGCTDMPHPDSSSWIASTAVASIVAAALSSLFNYLLKDKEYKNDYYKKVIETRMAAYKAVQEILASLSNDTLDFVDDKGYMNMFEVTLSMHIDNYNLDISNQYIKKADFREDELYGFRNFMKNLSFALAQRDWLNHDLIDCLQQLQDSLNAVLISAIQRKVNLVVIAKEKHTELLRLKTGIQHEYHKDMQDLQNVPEFFKNKRENENIAQRRTYTDTRGSYPYAKGTYPYARGSYPYARGMYPL